MLQPSGATMPPQMLGTALGLFRGVGN